MAIFFHNLAKDFDRVSATVRIVVLRVIVRQVPDNNRSTNGAFI